MSIHQFRLRESPLVPMTWQDRLTAATSESDVVGVVRDYAATLSPGDISRLPEPCRPGKFFDANDVTSYAFALVRHDCTDGVATARLVRKLSAFFSNASIRLAQIMAGTNVQEDDSRRSA